ncbi:MAG: putative secreted protein [Rhodobacteraceae bacterium HLUCCO07]|nr:MAG: putative secreted protein [Rhodobacteraceae bacterium HLUCCO07]
MGVTSALVLYAVLWFLTLLVIIPIRLKTQGDVGQIVRGTQAGAPHEHHLKAKALITTVVAFVLWAIIAGIIITGTITVRDLDWFGRMGPPSQSE